MTSAPDRDSSIAAARQLADALDAGHWPPYQTTRIRMEPGEGCFAQAPVQLYQYTESEATYVHKSAGGFSIMGAAIAAGTAIGNRSRAAAAARQAAAQWRHVGQGVIYFTSHRMLIHDQLEYHSLWYQNVMTAECDSNAIFVQMNGNPRSQLVIPNVDWYFVLFYRLAFGQVVRPQL